MGNTVHPSTPAGLLSLLQRLIAAPAMPAAFELGTSATTWIARPLGRTVTCESGTLWLTFDNEPADVILEAGQSYGCASAGHTAHCGLQAVGQTERSAPAASRGALAG